MKRTWRWMILVLGLNLSAAERDELDAFHPAEEGMQRFVIELPHKERGEEDAFKVELIPGKMMETDGVNQVRLGFTVEAKPLEGWGYTYYNISGTGMAMSTMMAAPPGTKTMKSFVSGAPLLIRYNSRLPVVVYAPDGSEIRYRIWEAPADRMKAEQK